MRGSSLTSLLCLATLFAFTIGPIDGHGGRVAQRGTSRSIIHKSSVGKHSARFSDGRGSFVPTQELVILVTESSPTSSCLETFLESARVHFPDIPVIAATYNARYHASLGESVLLFPLSIQMTIGQARKNLVNLAAQRGYIYAIMASDTYSLLPSTDFSVLIDSLSRGADFASPSVCSGVSNDCNSPPCMLFMGELGEKERIELGEWLLREEVESQKERKETWGNGAQIGGEEEWDLGGKRLANPDGDDEDEDIFTPIFGDDEAEEERIARLKRRKKRELQRQINVEKEIIRAYEEKEKVRLREERNQQSKSIAENKARIQIASVVDKYYRVPSSPRHIAQLIPYMAQNTSDFGDYCSETAVIQGVFAARVTTLEKMNWDTKVVSDLSPHDYDVIFSASVGGGKEEKEEEGKEGRREGMRFAQCMGTRVRLGSGCNEGHLEASFFPSVMYIMKKWGIGVLWDEKLDKVFMLPRVEEALKEAKNGGGRGEIKDDVFGLTIHTLRRDVHPKSEISPLLTSPVESYPTFISEKPSIFPPSLLDPIPNPLYNHLHPLLTSVFGSYLGHSPTNWNQFLYFSHRPIGSFVTCYSVKATLIQSPPPPPLLSTSSTASSSSSFEQEQQRAKPLPVAPLHRKMKISGSPVTTIRLEVAVPNRTTAFHKSFLFPLALWTTGGVGVRFERPHLSRTPAFHYSNSSSPSSSFASTPFPSLPYPSTPSFTRSLSSTTYHPSSPPPLYFITFYTSDLSKTTEATLLQIKNFGFSSILLAAPSSSVPLLEEKYGSFVRVVEVKGSFSVERGARECTGEIEREISSSSIDPIIVIATANFLFPPSLPDLIRKHVSLKTSIFAPECFDPSSPLPTSSSSSSSSSSSPPSPLPSKHFGSLIALYLSDYGAVGGVTHRWGRRDSINHLLQTLSSSDYLLLRPSLPSCKLTSPPLSVHDPTRPAPHISVPFPLSPTTNTEAQTIFNSAVELVIEGGRRGGGQQQQLPFQIQALLVGAQVQSAEIYPKSQVSSSFGFYKIITKVGEAGGGDRSLTLLVGSYLVPWVTKWRLLEAEVGAALSMMELREGARVGGGVVEEEVPLVRLEAMKRKEEEGRRRREEEWERMRGELEKDRERRRETREAQRRYHESLRERVAEENKISFEDEKREMGGGLRLVNQFTSAPVLDGGKVMGRDERRGREKLRERLRG